VARPFFAKPTPFPSIEELEDEEEEELALVEEEEVAEEPRPAKSGLQDLSDFDGVPHDNWLDATVQRTTNYGIHVLADPPNGGKARSGLVHISQLSDHFVTEEQLEDYLEGQALVVRIVKVDKETGRLSLSMREPNQPRQRKSDLESPDVENGSAASAEPAANASDFSGVSQDTWLTGEVRATFTFGVLLKVEAPGGGGSMVGLLHISAMLDPGRAFEVGEEIRVRLANVDLKGNRLSFTTLEKVSGAVLKASKEEWLQGTVQHVQAKSDVYSLMVNVSGQIVSGMLRLSEVSGAEPLEAGDRVRVRLFRVRGDKVYFTMLSESRRNTTLFEELSASQPLDARVLRMLDYGLLVEVSHPDGYHLHDGLLHVSGMDQRVAQDIPSFYQVGSELKVLKKSIKNGRLSLIMPMDEEEVVDRKEPIDLDELDDMDLESVLEPEPEPEASTNQLEGFDRANAQLRAIVYKIKDPLLKHGYDSIDLLKMMSKTEWEEMKEVCGLRPSDAVKLRIALGGRANRPR